MMILLMVMMTKSKDDGFKDEIQVTVISLLCSGQLRRNT